MGRMSKVFIVISDLHLGAGPLDDCDGELEKLLVSFIMDLCSRPSEIELIINGDFLDFAQAPPWSGPELESTTPLGIPLCFTEEQSAEKLKAIAGEHAAVFNVLGEFLAANSEHRLVINPGNHDVDFFWHDVREVFVSKVSERVRGVRGQIYFNLSQVYRPEQLPNVWIEHGNQYDPANWFYVDEYDAFTGSRDGRKLYWDAQNQPVFKDRAGVRRLYECLGTRFLIKFLNKLDEDYPFVDNVKPFSRFLSIFGASVFARGYGPLKAALAVWRMTRYLGGAIGTDHGGLLNVHQTPIDPVAALLAKEVKRMSVEQRTAFHRALRSRGFDLDRSALLYLEDAVLGERLLMFLSENLDLLDGLPDATGAYLESAGGRDAGGYLTLASRFTVNETKELARAAQRIIAENGVDAVIMGHTHEPVKQLPNLRYFNTGSWTRNYRGGDERMRSWEILRPGSGRLFPYELNYVEIQPDIQDSLRMLTYANGS